MKNIDSNEISYCKLQPGEVPSLLAAIANILHEVEAHDLSTAEKHVWDWQYADLPLHQSHVYVAKYQNRIIGYYHIPCYTVDIAVQSFTIGQIQSVAVLNEFRGKAVFQKLAAFANEDANRFMDVIYTFPNHRSIHTFLKYNNFKLVSTFPVYILPVSIANIVTAKFRFLKPLKVLFSLPDVLFRAFAKRLKKDESIQPVTEITPQVEELFLQFGKNYDIRLHRDKDFLNWRYLNSPKGVHSIYGLTRQNELTAVVIVKNEDIFSSKGFVVMDFAYKTPVDFQKMLSNFHSRTKTTGSAESFVFISGLDKNLNTLKKCGFIGVPQRFVPRKLNLLARWTGREITANLIQPQSWLVTMGDWDVF